MTPGSRPQWLPFRAGATLGEIGSEAGLIVRDDEYAESARITLEQMEPRAPFRQPVARYAITCGIYGWMVHTRFFSTEEDAIAAYEAMKSEMARLTDSVPEVTATDPDFEESVKRVGCSVREFIERFP